MQMQRTILWVIFSMSLILLWDAWQQHTGGPSMFGPAPATPGSEPALDGAGNALPAVPGGAADSGGVPVAGASSSAGAAPAVPSAGGTGSVAGASQAPAAGNTGAADSTAQSSQLQNDVLSLAISSRGGVIINGQLLKHRDRITKENFTLFSNKQGQFFLEQSGLINAPSGARFPDHHTDLKVAQSSDSSLVLTGERGGLKLERKYELQPGSYVVAITDTVTNVGAAPLSPVIYRQLTRDDHVPASDDSFYMRSFVGPVVYTDATKFQKIDFEDVADGSAEHATAAADGWAGIMQHYFATALIPTAAGPREYYTQQAGPGLYSVGVKQALGDLAAGQSKADTVRLFAGPQDQELLAKLAPGLELTVDYGFLTIICQPIWWLLEKLHGLVGNWGWAIVFLTLIIKTVFFPLQAASYKSMARMKAVAPRLTALRERFGDDRVKMNQAMMELYKTEKINPIGGCLPVLVQIPVFIALYWVLLASVEMRDAPWIGWIQDLASPDPYYILPLLMAISMFVQVKLNPKPPDPVQAKVMMAMPIIFSVMFFLFPAGLVLYWLVNNLYSIAQQWVITRKIVGDKA